MTYDSKKYHAEYYQKNKQKAKEQGKLWRERNKEKNRLCMKESYHRRKSDPLNIQKFLLKNAKARAIQKGIEFNLKLEDIVLPLVCPIMNIPFNRNEKRYTYSIDRIDSSKGYIVGNVQWIHKTINQMKWNSSQEEFIEFCKAVAAHNQEPTCQTNFQEA